MIQTGWRLERTLMTGAGFPESRLEGLNLNWSDPLEPTGHAALWADNGTGKTTITALRYALYLPNARDFIRGGSDRSLAKLVRSGDVCHVVEQATRVVHGELQRMVVGMVAYWRDGGTQDLENPSRLHRVFYGWLTGSDGPAIDDLPFRTELGRWASGIQFVTALREILPRKGAVPPHHPSDRQGEWRKWLDTADVDIEQIRFQAAMNASEGGVDRVMRFTDSDAFVRWLIGATMSMSTVEQITNSIDRLRENAAARPSWEDELHLWERVTEPLLNLAIAHEQVQHYRRAAATAEADAAALLADADGTIKALMDKEQAAKEQFEQHERRRRDASTNLRRVQAHRLGMRLRAAELRVREAEEASSAQRSRLDEASRVLAAWQSVPDVLLAIETASAVAHLEERRDAVELSAERLGQEERRHRTSLARLLTDKRDSASTRLRTATDYQNTARQAVTAADETLRTCRTEHATRVERHRLLKNRITKSEQTIAEAISSGLLGEGADPTQTDSFLELRITEKRTARRTAKEDLSEIAGEIAETENEKSAARRGTETARDDARRAERKALSVTQRVDALTSDERLLDVLSGPGLDLWADHAVLSEALHERAERADTDAAAARKAEAETRRIVNSVGADGLLPSSATAEQAARRCQDSEVSAWPGWRWLANTMRPADARTFATARPEIASGVVVSHPDLVDRAVELVRGIELDSALWVGAVIDPDAALRDSDPKGGGSTRAHILLPHPGVFDREKAEGMVASAKEMRARAAHDLETAKRSAEDARRMLAELEQFWASLPNDSRPALEETIRAADERKRTAEHAERTADERIEELGHRSRERDRDYHAATEAIDAVSERRRELVPVITATQDLTESKEKLPEIREAIVALDQQIRDLERDKPVLAAEAESADDVVRECARRRDDAAEKLRAAGLAATTNGPVPEEGEEVVRARLEAVKAALREAEVPPELNDAIARQRQILSDAEARLDADPGLRTLTEEFAASDGARHSVALDASKRLAQEAENAARTAYAKADADAEHTRAVYDQRAQEFTDRSYSDIEGFPSVEEVTEPERAEQFARQLNDLAGQLNEVQRSEERLAKEQSDVAQQATSQSKLVAMAVKALRHLMDPTLSGRSANDIDQLVERAEHVSERVRTTAHDLSESERRQRSEAGIVRVHANGPQARKVEDREDPRIVDLIRRLRADDQLQAEAEHIAGHLEQRIATLRDDLANHKEHVRTCASMLYLNADNALLRLRSYQNQSRLPRGLGEWSERNFVLINHEPAPTDESVAVDRVTRVVHAQLAPGVGRSDAQTMLFAATRALVDAPFQVRILKPHTDMALDRVDVAELKNFSGGQRVTAGVLLYATMTRVRASGDATSIGWLWLDNPFGQASADQFVRTMRLAADKLGLQLVFTAAPKDKGALSMFDRITTLARRSRPSSGEKIVVTSSGQYELVDLTLVQRDVMAVLGE